MKRSLIRAVSATAILAAALPAARAELAAEDAYQYRQSVMNAMRYHLGAASMIVRGIVEDEGFLLYHAEAIAGGAAEIHRVFQEGSAVEGSEALPVIWEDPDKFAAAISRAEEATANFRDVVADEESTAEDKSAAFREMGMSCRGCHDDFRVPRD